MARTITVGIDLGTAVTRTVVLGWQPDSAAPEVLASVSIPTKGVRHGYIVNLADAAATIRRCAEQASKEAGVPIKRAVFSLGGTSLSAENSQGSAIVSKADGEVTAFDMKTAQSGAEETIDLKNRRVIYTSPIVWKLDGREVPGKPDGMHGIKLEVKLLSITCLAQHLDDLLSAAGEADIEVLDIIPSSVAASSLALSERQKQVGVMLVNIGAETVSIAVFENGALIGLNVFPIGSTDITNDIALGFRITLEEAESLKVGSVMSASYPKRKVDEIIEARLSDIFELIDGYLKRIKRSGLLPAGVVLTGGGSANNLVESLSKEMLRLPSRVGADDLLGHLRGPVRDSSWFVAFGLAIMGRDSATETRTRGSRGSGGGGGIKKVFKEFLRQFLP